MMATASDSATGTAEPGTGRTRWRRFAGLLTPVLLAVALMFVGVLTGSLPISVAAEGLMLQNTNTLTAEGPEIRIKPVGTRRVGGGQR